jgi:hypothetical protein
MSAAEGGGGSGGTSGRRKAGRPVEEAPAVDTLAAQLADLREHPIIFLPTGPVVDFSGVVIKPDHERRPFWVTPVGRVFLESTYKILSIFFICIFF